VKLAWVLNAGIVVMCKRDRSLLATKLIALAILASQQSWAAEPESGGVPQPAKKSADLQFKVESFTFVRVKYSDVAGAGRRGSWATDYPDSDLNISARFAKETGLKTDPAGKVLALTDPELKNFPFIYLAEPGRLALSDAEAKSLRDYLLGGGFLMVDDFWGDAEWERFAVEFKKVFPDREPKELPLGHPLFQCFYKIDKKPQVPSIHVALAGGTTERPGAEEVHIRGVTDDSGRLMAVICHNTDYGDGWERQDADPLYFREFSQKRAYPMGLNILVYALTTQSQKAEKD
jgi:hypothetical protein